MPPKKEDIAAVPVWASAIIFLPDLQLFISVTPSATSSSNSVFNHANATEMTVRNRLHSNRFGLMADEKISAWFVFMKIAKGAKLQVVAYCNSLSQELR